MFTAETSETVTHQSTPVPNDPGLYPFRLLGDEKVLGTFPIARRRRPLGKLASYLFVTDSRVIYSAEAKTITSSSTHLKEYQVQTVTGVEVARHRGLNALGAAAALGAVLNFIGLIIATGLIAAWTSSSYSYSNPFAGLSVLFGILAAASLIVGTVVVAVLGRPTASITIVGPGQQHNIAQEQDLPKLFVVILLFLIFGPLISLAVLVWVILRELGIFGAGDAQLFANTKNVDQISYEVGALILDVQARGKLAGQN
jgi:hypothetical protein